MDENERLEQMDRRHAALRALRKKVGKSKKHDRMQKAKAAQAAKDLLAMRRNIQEGKHPLSGTK